MPLYQYQAFNREREAVKGEVTADNTEEAVSQILAKGLFPQSLKEKTKLQPLTQSELRAVNERLQLDYGTPRHYLFRISDKKLIPFTRHFAQMLEAGLPILRVLQILEKQEPPGLMRRTIKHLALDVEQGISFSEALSRHPRVFDDLYVKMTNAGEISGKIDIILKNIVLYKEKMLALKRRIIRAMIYPCFVICFAIALPLFMAFVIAPMVGVKIPYLADAGTSLAEKCLGLIMMILIFLTGRMLLKQSRVGRYIFDSFKLKIPILGRIFRKAAVARFGRILGTLTEAGVPILDSLKTARSTVGNEVFAQSIDKIYAGVKDGKDLVEMMSQSRTFDTISINMVQVGEETGDLDKMLLKLADNYEEDVDAHIGYLAGLMEPALIITICVVMGIMIILLYSRVMSSIGQLTGS